MSAFVVGDLLIRISDKTHKDLLSEKFRCAPIEVKIDAALNLRLRILEVIGEAGDTGEFIFPSRG